MSRFYEPMFCCHWFVLKNKFLHKPCHHNPLLCNYKHHHRKNPVPLRFTKKVKSEKRIVKNFLRPFGSLSRKLK